MDTELAELYAMAARIDERTEAILTNQQALAKRLGHHEDQDRVDFKEVHDRVTVLARKQSWMLGIGGAAISAFLIVGGLFIKGLFGIG